MKNILRVVLLTAVIVVQPLVYANDATSALGTCLVDNLNGKERKEKAWQNGYFLLLRHIQKLIVIRMLPLPI